ncbi:unnamed protein product [Microthlaspi erraticum]|uniref:Endonuclease/exonuclease/phosphatase domain-containing protein n=1 Tax=Microthlaspi erraticum TaxID=1685480 RepID=A0A6D2JBP8_9BRAS|nr:unnamed protein product [Microthlaspi erraticum]
MLKRHATDVLAVFETHAGGDRASEICRGLGFENSFKVDAVGQSGGLWLLWRSGIGDVVIVEESEQFIHARISNGNEVLHVIAVYAAPTVSRRSGLWDQLRDLVGRISEPVLLGGDFNTIVRVDERAGGSGRLSEDSIAFGEWINDLSLIDMGFRGSGFTWKRGRSVNTFVAKRLDRVLCCAQTRLKWQEATVTHLPFLSSDHAPLYVQLTPVVSRDPKRRPFRFEAAWLKHPEFQELLKTSWRRDLSTNEALRVLQRTLVRWNKEVFGDVTKRKEGLLKEIVEVQEALETGLTDAILEREEFLMKELDVVLEQEEVLWFQKAREKWIPLGDRNTRFFHTSTIIRRRKNRIDMLRNEAGEWTTDEKEMESLAIAYFKRLYSMEDVEEVVDKLPSDGFEQLTAGEKQHLEKDFVASEVESAIRGMGKFKAPGPDGYQPVFYQSSWEMVGSSVTRFVLDFFRTGVLPPMTNDVLLVLLAKVSTPERIT